MSGAEFDDLYKPKAWIDAVPDDLREWLVRFAADNMARGLEPNWVDVEERIKEKWGAGVLPDTNTTIRSTVRKLRG